MIFPIFLNFSTFENFPIHLILLEKFPASQFDLKIGTLKGLDIQNYGIFEVGKMENKIQNIMSGQPFPNAAIVLQTSGVPGESQLVLTDGEWWMDGQR
ncbi:MAG: hypothetical protein AAGK60_13645, partial [Pseudomonadota bacterium]